MAFGCSAGRESLHHGLQANGSSKPPRPQPLDRATGKASSPVVAGKFIGSRTRRRCSTGAAAGSAKPSGPAEYGTPRAARIRWPTAGVRACARRRIPCGPDPNPSHDSPARRPTSGRRVEAHAVSRPATPLARRCVRARCREARSRRFRRRTAAGRRPCDARSSRAADSIRPCVD